MIGAIAGLVGQVGSSAASTAAIVGYQFRHLRLANFDG